MRKEIKDHDMRPGDTFNQAPTGHKIPEQRSKDDPAMAFKLPDCGVRAYGEFMHPLVADLEVVPDEYNKDEDKGNNQTDD